MATYRDVINRVLRPLGEPEISSGTTELSNSYHKLIGSFVNMIKEEIEDAHNWRSLQATTTLSDIAAGSQLTTLTGTNERSRLVRWHDANNDRVLPMAFYYEGAQGSTNAHRLLELDNSHIRTMSLESWDDRGPPRWFSIVEPAVDTTELRVQLWPKLDRIYTFRFNLIVPQAYLEDDDLDTEIKIPSRPLVMGAIWYALQDRGEELGPNGMFTEQRYLKALDDAIARDSAEQGDYAELVRV